MTYDADVRRGARALLLDREDRILLVHRVKQGSEYFPTVGGGIDPEDRTPEDAMRREAFEEMGAVVGPARLIFLSTAVHQERLAVQYFFLARLITMNYDVRSDPPVAAGERHDPYWTSWNELADLDLRPPELKDYLVTNSVVLREIARTL